MTRTTEFNYRIYKQRIGWRIDIIFKQVAPDDVPCALPLSYSKRLYFGGIERAIRVALRTTRAERLREETRHAAPVATGSG